MAFDFPASPTDGTIYIPAGGPQYQYSGGAWRVASSSVPIATAQARNRIVNGAMQVSQETGNTAGTTSGYFAADQWSAAFVTTGAVSFQRVQVATPNGSRNRLRLTVTTADTSLAATEYCQIYQSIEGTRVADFGYGAAGARQTVLRFGFKGPAGTYGVSVRNGDTTRSYITSFVISAGQANTDTEQAFVIPGDVTGTWPVDTSRAYIVTVAIAGGANQVGVAGWQAGGLTTLASATNGLATVNNTFELFDVSLHLDPLNTGIAPPWTLPDEAQEFATCQRYLEYIDGLNIYQYGNGGTTTMNPCPFKVMKRVSPAVTIAGWATTANVTAQTPYNTSVYMTNIGVNVVANGVADMRGIVAAVSARM